MSYEEFDIEKARALREKATDGFRKQVRISLAGTIMGSLPAMTLVTYAAMKWASAAEPELRMFYVLLFLLGLLMNTGIWALFGMDGRLLFLLKEIKQLRLDLLASREAPPESATGGVESLSNWAAQAVKTRTVAIVMVVLTVLGILLAVIAYQITFATAPAFGGQEVAEVHVLKDGSFRVYSRISLTKCADNVATVPVRLPLPGATLESVAVDGRPVPFTPVTDTADTYAVMPGLPERALENATLEVVWSPQNSDITRKDGELNFMMPLRGLVPLSAYTMNAVIEEDAPYQFAFPGAASARSLSHFWTKRSDGGYREAGWGHCGVVVKTVENTP